MDRSVGTVQWFDDQKGYGFVNHEDVEDDIFVHYTEIEQDGFKKLDEGDRVEFDLVEEDKGLQAHSVIRVGSEEDIEEVAA